MVNNIFILDKYYKTKKILTVNGKNTFFNDLFTQDLSTGTESYEFYTNVQDIEETDYIMFYYHEQYKLFQIVEIEMEHDEGNIITYCYGESACLELLNGAIRPFEGEFNALSFFNHVLEGTEWSVGVYNTPLADKVITVKCDKTTQIWSCIQDYMEDFEYELNTRVIYENGNVKNKLIDIYMEGELGNKTYKRFEFGRNVQGIVKKKDLYDWCTALIIETDKDIDIVDLDYSDNGGFIKAKGSDVLLATKENNIYNNGKPYIYASFEDDSESGQEAIENAVAELRNRCVPKFNYECDTILTYEEYEQINIGDTVYVIDHSFEPSILLEARVGKLEISFTNRNDCKCNLTNYKELKSKIDVTLTGSIQGILDAYFPIGSNQIKDGAVTEDKLDHLFVEQLEADIIVANKIITEELIAENIKAINGEFENLKAENGEFENLVTNNFQANNAEITNLKANYAEIQTLVNGHLTSDNIQSLILTSDKVTVANAFIKDAMIDTVNASKINTGTLNTNNVIIQSEDGGITIADETMQFKDGDKVRIQIGKDETGNFTFVLYDENGTGVLIDETGIKDSAIGDGLIRNDHIADGANISSGKLDISSLIEGINNDGTKYLKSNKIYLDEEGQSLTVAFNKLSNKVDTIEQVTVNGDLGSVIEQVTSNTTNIGIAQGQIDTLISNTTITKSNGEVVQLKDEYSSIKQTVDSFSSTIGSLETNYKSTLKTSSTQYYLSNSATSLSGGEWSDTSLTWTSGKYMWQRMKYTYTNGSVTYGTAICIQGAKGENGANGKDGKDGADGVGVSSVTNYYLVSTEKTGITTSTSGWTTDVQTATNSLPYLWNYEKITYTNGTSIDTTPCIIGVYNAGTNGKDGKGIKSIIEYYTRTQDTTAPTSGWSTSVPLLTTTYKYLWNYEVITYTDNTTYTSEKRIIGTYGETGDKGQSLVSSVPQWYLSTSKTTQSGGNWQETMPSVSEGKYLWVRYKLTWANPTDTTYSTPVLEQVAEKVKEVVSKQATLEQSLDGFKTTVSKNYATKNELTGEVTELESNISQVEQTANKISWIVKSGTSSSNMTLTDKVYSLITNNITLKADHINLHGYVTANSNFKINTDGSIEAKNGKFSGSITGGTITGTKIIGNGNGNRIVINNADYEIQTGGTTKGFLGLRTLDDGFDTARLALSSTGLKRANDNYFVVVPYNANANPQSYAYPYVDIAYRCQGFAGDDGRSDVSNIKMYGDGVMRLSPIKKLEITTNCSAGAYSGSGEKDIAQFGSSTSEYYPTYLDLRGCIRNHQSNHGLIISAKRTDGGNTFNARAVVYSDGFRTFAPVRPTSDNVPHYLGGGSNRWQTLYSVNSVNTSSDITLKENIKYLCDTPNARAIKDENLNIQDMYDFIRDDLFLTSYNFIQDEDKDEKLGFIAQDIVDTKVGEKILVCNRDRDNTLGYDSGNFASVISGALKVAIQKIEQLEARINELENQ